MWVWGKAHGEGRETATVVRGAVEGKPRHDLLRDAVRTLLASGRADRVGVWIESVEGDSGDSSEVSSFRGVVADKDGDATPAEWSRLSPEAPLPVKLLIGLQTVEQEPAGSPGEPLIGAVVEMQSALWVPVQMHGRLRGVLFAGGRKRQAHLPRAVLESVAAELALVMELEEERRLRRESREDSRRVLAALAGLESPSDILAGLVKDCTLGVREGGPNAVFAAIGSLVDSPKTRKESIHPPAQSMRFTWQSGAAGWIRALESGPLSGVWRRALESHRVVGSEPGAASFCGEVARVVALPLEAGGESLGVLVAGIRRSSTCLAVVERLELRAALVTSVLLRQKHSEEVADLELRHKEVLAALEKQPERSKRERAERGITEILNVIEWLEEGVVLFGASQEIRAVNSRFGQIVGLAPEELAGIKTLDDLVGSLSARAADAGTFAESWHTLARSTEGALREELHLVRPVPRVLERVTRPIVDEQGALLGHVEIYRDLTAQRVFQSRLLQTDKLAELGQMVTGIAHELSNPLTSILGYAQRLLLRRDPMGDSHEARQIFQEAERATAILRQLLLSARESRPERRSVALNQIVSRTLELQRFSLAADNVHVQLDLEPVLPFVQGDAGQLQQVLMNLIGNARQAIEEQGKGGTIRVKTKRIAERRVLLEVSDDGPGIPQAIQARIFDPFFTTKPAGVGTGLGLAIVLGIVREHGGQLHLTSKVGRGTIFSIELPAIAAVEIPLPASSGAPGLRPRLDTLSAPDLHETAPAGSVLAAWAGNRVLVLEDEPTVARLIADVLEDEGLRVDVLLDPREALDRTGREEYALAICDMKMPELDGEQFYQALAREKNPLRERFLFVTGDVLAAHTRDFLERNHLPHVAKPFRVEELTEKIRGVLEATSPHGSSGIPAANKNAARQ
jgi:signal transduction histidine kinase/ActR/RegA family two-component response regulator